jgi:predicted alpha/beta-fold hydrolase
VIHARDDPIIHIDCMPLSACKENPNLIVGITERGGHVQYFDGCGMEKGLGNYLYG